VVSFTLWPLYPCSHWVRGWVGPRADLDAVGKTKTPFPVKFMDNELGRITKKAAPALLRRQRGSPRKAYQYIEN